jgi:hypothetical protein
MAACASRAVWSSPRDIYSPDEYPAVQELLYGVLDNARTLALLDKP